MTKTFFNSKGKFSMTAWNYMSTAALPISVQNSQMLYYKLPFIGFHVTSCIWLEVNTKLRHTWSPEWVKRSLYLPSWSALVANFKWNFKNNFLILVQHNREYIFGPHSCKYQKRSMKHSNIKIILPRIVNRG
jgi:hypothetical protein